MDGHGSHVANDFMWECFNHDIYLLFLPPHSSHITQPCDLSCFSVLKRAYRRLLGNLVFLMILAQSGKKISFAVTLRLERKRSEKRLSEQGGWRRGCGRSISQSLFTAPTYLIRPRRRPNLLQNLQKSPLHHPRSTYLSLFEVIKCCNNGRNGSGRLLEPGYLSGRLAKA